MKRAPYTSSSLAHTHHSCPRPRRLLQQRAHRCLPRTPSARLKACSRNHGPQLGIECPSKRTRPSISGSPRRWKRSMLRLPLLTRAYSRTRAHPARSLPRRSVNSTSLAWPRRWSCRSSTPSCSHPTPISSTTILYAHHLTRLSSSGPIPLLIQDGDMRIVLRATSRLRYTNNTNRSAQVLEARWALLLPWRHQPVVGEHPQSRLRWAANRSAKRKAAHSGG